jgi:hypothetical protein
VLRHLLAFAGLALGQAGAAVVAQLAVIIRHHVQAKGAQQHAQRPGIFGGTAKGDHCQQARRVAAVVWVQSFVVGVFADGFGDPGREPDACILGHRVDAVDQQLAARRISDFPPDFHLVPK